MLEYSNTITYIKINYHCRLSYLIIFTSTNWCMYNNIIVLFLTSLCVLLTSISVPNLGVNITAWNWVFESK